MKKKNFFIVVFLLAVSLVGMSACSHSSEDAASIKNDSDSQDIPQSTDESSKTINSSTDSTEKSENSNTNHSEGTSTEKTNKINENIHQEENTTTIKVEGRNEFIERLDSIQKELDALPEKKDSDKGVTNAMKNYYGMSYEKYDKELNEIYALLKKELSPETMKELKAKQNKWIEQKEKKANDERLKYKGATFENVAMYISLYESTKEKCYELVNTYLTD